MNESAILHIPDSQYCFAVGEKKLVIRLRMAKEDADASVTLIYAGKYQFQQSREQIPMEIRYTDRLYHYYETTLVLTDVRLAYVFCIRQQGTTYYFCEDGVVLQYDFAEGFYNFFQMPYINRNDVLPTVKWMKSAVFYQIFVDRFFCGNTKKDRSYINTVSYTHLTLPTNREVKSSVVAVTFKKKKKYNLSGPDVRVTRHRSTN